MTGVRIMNEVVKRSFFREESEIFDFFRIFNRNSFINREDIEGVRDRV